MIPWEAQANDPALASHLRIVPDLVPTGVFDDLPTNSLSGQVCTTEFGEALKGGGYTNKTATKPTGQCH